LAAKKGSFEITKLLLDAGAVVSSLNNKNETALDIAGSKAVKNLLQERSITTVVDNVSIYIVMLRGMHDTVERCYVLGVLTS